MNNMENRVLDCDIVRDLLPLYHDGVVSETTADTVKRHIEQCEACRKEYEEICMEVPVESSDVNTGERFAVTMKKIRRKRTLLTVVVAVLLSLSLIGGYFVQAQLPIANIPDEEIEVHRVYGYKTEEGYKFFVLYSHPSYDYTTGKVSVAETENGKTLVMDIKKPLIAKKHEANGIVENVWLYECGYSSGDNGEIIYEEFDAVEFGGKIVWSMEGNADDPIPEYVYEYEKFSLGVSENPELYENPELLLEESGNDSSSAVITTWLTDIEQGYLGAGYGDGRTVLWDLDGNIIHEEFHNKE